jgi:hypothetical protein
VRARRARETGRSLRRDGPPVPRRSRLKPLTRSGRRFLAAGRPGTRRLGGLLVPRVTPSGRRSRQPGRQRNALVSSSAEASKVRYGAELEPSNVAGLHIGSTVRSHLSAKHLRGLPPSLIPESATASAGPCGRARGSCRPDSGHAIFADLRGCRDLGCCSRRTRNGLICAQPHCLILVIINCGVIQPRRGLSRAGPNHGRPPARCRAGTRIPPPLAGRGRLAGS